MGRAVKRVKLFTWDCPVPSCDFWYLPNVDVPGINEAKPIIIITSRGAKRPACPIHKKTLTQKSWVFRFDKEGKVIE